MPLQDLLWGKVTVMSSLHAAPTEPRAPSTARQIRSACYRLALGASVTNSMISDTSIKQRGPSRGDLKKGAITYVKARRPLIPLIEPDGSHLTLLARAQFLKRGGKLREIPPQPRYSRFAKLRESNGLQFQSHLRTRRV
jgi:hypothetical protein